LERPKLDVLEDKPIPIRTNFAGSHARSGRQPGETVRNRRERNHQGQRDERRLCLDRRHLTSNTVNGLSAAINSSRRDDLSNFRLSS
jgi:hypothetical protein